MWPAEPCVRPRFSIAERWPRVAGRFNARNRRSLDSRARRGATLEPSPDFLGGAIRVFNRRSATVLLARIFHTSAITTKSSSIGCTLSGLLKTAPGQWIQPMDDPWIHAPSRVALESPDGTRCRRGMTSFTRARFSSSPHRDRARFLRPAPSHERSRGLRTATHGRRQVGSERRGRGWCKPSMKFAG